MRCLGFLVVWLVSLIAIFLSFDSHDPNYGDSLIRWTARHSLFFWFLAAFLLIDSYSTMARFLWVIAAISFLIHVGVAFEYAHHWSHEAAFRHVQESSGYGEGIFVSYFFTVLWTVDALWWLMSRETYETRSRTLGWLIHGFMVFIIFNGTVIFESGFIRWAGLIGLGILGIRWQIKRR